MHKLLLLFHVLTVLAIKPPIVTALVKPKAEVIHQTLKFDTSKVNLRAFDAKALNEYRTKPSFNYYVDDDPQGLSWWDRFWRWFWHMLSRLFGNSHATTGNSSSLLKYLVLLIIIGVIVYVVVKVMGGDWGTFFQNNSKSITIPYSESSENIHEINFDDQIEKAVNNHNYRIAVRLLYLKALKQLSDAQLIHWQLSKTNSAYLNELTDMEKRQSFSMLTRQFEYVWYGDFTIDGQAFQNISALFHDFKQLLS